MEKTKGTPMKSFPQPRSTGESATHWSSTQDAVINETRLLWKMDLRICLVLVVVYIMAFVDRWVEFEYLYEILINT